MSVRLSTFCPSVCLSVNVLYIYPSVNILFVSVLYECRHLIICLKTRKSVSDINYRLYLSVQDLLTKVVFGDLDIGCLAIWPKLL